MQSRPSAGGIWHGSTRASAGTLIYTSPRRFSAYLGFTPPRRLFGLVSTLLQEQGWFGPLRAINLLLQRTPPPRQGVWGCFCLSLFVKGQSGGIGNAHPALCCICPALAALPPLHCIRKRMKMGKINPFFFFFFPRRNTSQYFRK